MRRFGPMFALVMLCLMAATVQAFTLIGNAAVDPTDGAAGPIVANAGGAGAPGVNFSDPMGRPVRTKEGFRWYYPELTYAYDPTFVRYFGLNGMRAVSNAFRVLNDFFEPEDKAYDGVSSMDLITEYDKLYSTWEFNPTANLNNITDMQTLVLGLLVNQLGLGNPHRYCFIIRDCPGYLAPNAAGGPAGDFQIEMRSYDPYSYRASDEINGVKHGYWLWNDGQLPANAGIPNNWDAMEYTVGNDEAYTAVAAIRDVIDWGGMSWPGPAPTVFRTPGVFFAPDNAVDDPQNFEPKPWEPANVDGIPNAHLAVRNRDQPRHTLTFDDAGGLRYLYRTNNIVWSVLPAANANTGVTLVTPADMNPTPPMATGAVPPNRTPFLIPQRRTVTGINMSGIIPTVPSGGLLRAERTVLTEVAMRGGIDKIKFKYTAYDSLIGSFYQPNTVVWNDVFVTNSMPTDLVPANPPYFHQVVQRTTQVPDIVFMANDIPFANNVFPVITVPNTAGWSQVMVDAAAIPNAPPVVSAQPGFNPLTPLGPGRCDINGTLQYIFGTRAPYFNVNWNGEQGLEGNMVVQNMWGWITGTGQEDFIMFPELNITQRENILGGSSEVSSITHVDVLNGDETDILADGSSTYQDYRIDAGLTGGGYTGAEAINRATDTVFIYGRRLDSVTEIQILDNSGVVLQRIPAEKYIMSDLLIRLAPGSIQVEAESRGVLPVSRRQLRLFSAVGEGPIWQNFGEIKAGRPQIIRTQYDGLPWNTQKSLVINGSGFLTGDKNATTGNTKCISRISQIEFWMDDSNDQEARSRYEDDNITGHIITIDLDDSIWNGKTIVDESGVPRWVPNMTDTQFIIPANWLSEQNASLTGRGYGNIDVLHGIFPPNNMIRSDGDSNDTNLRVWGRQIRLNRNRINHTVGANPIGLQDGNTTARPRQHMFTHVGIGGRRADANHTTAELGPRILSVWTGELEPTAPPINTAFDRNKTWVRSSPQDQLTIIGYGLDLAFGIEFVDGDGALIQSVGAAPFPAGLPPQAINLRTGALDNSSLKPGCYIDQERSLPTYNGMDAYRIVIDPVAFGFGNAWMWDSNGAANNPTPRRRVVIRTPFGTAIAPPTQWIFIDPS